jgi:hypothetical protein
MIAFALNVAAVFLVGAGSGLILTLAGVFKDILLITGSVLIFGASITPLQVFGTCFPASSALGLLADRSLQVMPSRSAAWWCIARRETSER